MKFFLTLTLAVAIGLTTFAQSLPVKHTLEDGPLVYNFVTFLKGTEASYPKSTQGWSTDMAFTIADGVGFPSEINITGDQPFEAAPGDIANNIENQGNANSANSRGIGMTASQNDAAESFPLGLMINCDATKVPAVTVSYRVIGFVNETPGSLHLLYRTSKTGPWTEIPAGRYRAAQAGVATFSNISIDMPNDVAFKEDLQLMFTMSKELDDRPAPAPAMMGVTFEIRELAITPILPTHPVPHVLANGDFLFEGFDDAEQTTYPPFFQGWTGQTVEVANGTGGYPTNLIPTGDTELLGSSAPPNGTSVKNEGANGISIQANRTAGTPQSIALAINTKGATGIDISWTGVSTFSFIDGNATMQLQYRIGEFGEWINIDGHEYLNAAGSATAGATEDFGPFRLPVEAEDQDVVEFRWIHFLSGPTSSNSNRSAVDNISITTEGAVGQPPIAAFAISNDEPDAGQIVTFSNQSAGEPDSYLWNFGDGVDSISTETSPFHTYSEGGEYIVSLIAYNGFGSDTAYDTVNVFQNFAPVAQDDVSSTPMNTPDTIYVSSNDADSENNINESSVAVVTEPSNGTVEPQGDGSFIYTPNTDFLGDDEFTYEICDLEGLCDTALVTITVFEEGGANIAPRAKNDAAVTGRNLAVVVRVLANDIDVDGQLDVQTLAVVVSALNGGTSINVSDSTITYSPNQSFTGIDSFQYSVCDDNEEALCDSAWVTVQVKNKVTSVFNNENAVKVYPNPASSMLNIELTGNGTSTVRIFNVLGKAVYSAQTNLKSFVIDVNNFTSGVYYLQVENNLGLNQRTVVIK